MSGLTCIVQFLHTLKNNDSNVRFFIVGNHMNNHMNNRQSHVLNGPFPPDSSTPILLEENTSVLERR